MTKHLEGKVAIVTGSGQGIGKGIAIYLAREGAKVITNNRKPGSGTIRHHKKEDMPEEDWNQMIALAGDAESTAEVIKAEGGEAIPFYGDVSDWDTAEKMVNCAIDTWGRIDIIVNNAAGMGSGSIVVCDKENWDKMTVPKINGSFNLMHFAVPHMIDQKFGRIINASSEAWLGMPDNPAYCTANAAVVGLTWASAKELWRHGITVNCYCPQGASPAHAVEYNAMVRNVKNITGHDPDTKLLKVVEENHGDPVGIGPAIAFLCTEDASYISGAVFSIYASGIVKYFADPKILSEIKKAEGEKLFAIDELKDAFRNKLLGPDYVSPASIKMW
jgi:3-oxoacyl-[acyl-carrier protein] reductase